MSGTTEYTTRAETTYQPSEIRALPDTGPNRGTLQALVRFGTTVEQQAARARLSSFETGKPVADDVA